MSDNKNAPKNDQDPELDDLLNSALQDMTKKKDDKPNDTTPDGGEAMQNMWGEEFIKEAAAQFESNMAAILGSFSGVPEDQITQEQIALTFNKMAEAASQVLKQGESSETEPKTDDTAVPKADQVSAAISQTLQNLNSNSENLQTPFSEQDLANMFNNFNLGEGGQEGNMFLPFMQGMMQSLLSKEVLYPSLKELVDKYPSWLNENKAKIEQSEYERFEKQQTLMQQVCAELENELDSDSEEVKRKRFEKVLELMQKMQDLGQPPTELVGDIGPVPQSFGPAAQDPSQCCIN